MQLLPTLEEAVKGCPPKITVEKRPLFTVDEADSLAGTFGILSSTTRLRLLHALIRVGELCVNDLADTFEMTPQAVSNHLQRLSDKGIVGTRRNGVQIFYRLIDPCVIELLNRGFCLSIEAANRSRS